MRGDAIHYLQEYLLETRMDLQMKTCKHFDKQTQAMFPRNINNAPNVILTFIYTQTHFLVEPFRERVFSCSCTLATGEAVQREGERWSTSQYSPTQWSSNKELKPSHF